MALSDWLRSKYYELKDSITNYATDFVNQLKDAIRDGFDVNYRPADELSTLLQVAIMSQNWDDVRYLLEAGADVNVTDGRGWNALMLAAESNIDPKTFKMIMDRTRNPNLENSKGMSALDLLAQRHAEGRDSYKDSTYIKLKMLLSRDADASNLNNIMQNTRDPYKRRRIQELIGFVRRNAPKNLEQNRAHNRQRVSRDRTPDPRYARQTNPAEIQNAILEKLKQALIYGQENEFSTLLQNAKQHGIDILASQENRNTLLPLALEGGNIKALSEILGKPDAKKISETVRSIAELGDEQILYMLDNLAQNFSKEINGIKDDKEKIFQRETYSSFMRAILDGCLDNNYRDAVNQLRDKLDKQSDVYKIIDEAIPRWERGNALRQKEKTYYELVARMKSPEFVNNINNEQSKVAEAIKALGENMNYVPLADTPYMGRPSLLDIYITQSGDYMTAMDLSMHGARSTRDRQGDKSDTSLMYYLMHQHNAKVPADIGTFEMAIKDIEKQYANWGFNNSGFYVQMLKEEAMKQVCTQLASAINHNEITLADRAEYLQQIKVLMDHGVSPQAVKDRAIELSRVANDDEGYKIAAAKIRQLAINYETNPDTALQRTVGENRWNDMTYKHLNTIKEFDGKSLPVELNKAVRDGLDFNTSQGKDLFQSILRSRPDSSTKDDLLTQLRLSAAIKTMLDNGYQLRNDDLNYAASSTFLNQDIFERMVEQAQDLNATDSFGHTAIGDAIDAFFSVAAMSIEDPDNAFAKKTADNLYDKIATLLEAGADPDIDTHWLDNLPDTETGQQVYDEISNLIDSYSHDRYKEAGNER